MPNLLKNIVSWFMPPIFYILYRKILQVNKERLESNPNFLFYGDDFMFKKLLRDARVYGEYGCGKSTKWVLNNTSAKIIAVDTSEDWIDVVASDQPGNNCKLNIGHADLGNLGKYGRPVNYTKRESFHIYTDYLWQQNDKPDVVLVDGRFRVCCFLTSLKFGEEGTCIVFDDYTNRPIYHVIEKYVSRIEECGRQCMFLVPAKTEIDFDELEKDINAFRHVMD